MPAEMSDLQLSVAMGTLRQDLPGDPIGYIERMVPVSQRCGCGAVHLLLDDPELDEPTRGSLHRLLATPFGEIPRQWIRRQYGFTNLRFGWDGLEKVAPVFDALVSRTDMRQAPASLLSDAELDEVMVAIRTDLPGMSQMLEVSVATRAVHAVSAQPGESGARAWKALIDEVMVAFSTPMRKFLDEYAMRRHGCRLSAINCCIIMAGEMDGPVWERHRFTVQTQQQLTPDC